MNSFLTNLDIPSSTMVLLHGRNPMAQNQNISVPGRYKVPAKQTMIITTTLPDDYNENVIAIRSSLQDVRFYIDGKLRKEYNAKKSAPIWQKLCQPLYILQYFVCRCRKGTLSGTYNIYE